MALGVVSGVLQARATGKGLLMQTSLLAQALSMQAMQVTRVENDLSPAQKWIDEKKDSMFDNNIAYEDIQEDYSVQGGAPQIAQYYRAYKTKNGALALGCLAMHARKRIASLFILKVPSPTTIVGYCQHLAEYQLTTSLGADCLMGF